MQITQELRDYAQKHQLDEQEAAQVGPAEHNIWVQNFRVSGLLHSELRLVLVGCFAAGLPFP